jgi:hypothetical protein
MSIMKDMGIEEYEPRVINQLLEFTYRKYDWEDLKFVYFPGGRNGLKLVIWYCIMTMKFMKSGIQGRVFQNIVLLITTSARPSNGTNFIKFATNNETCGSTSIGYDKNWRSKNNN